MKIDRGTNFTNATLSLRQNKSAASRVPDPGGLQLQVLYEDNHVLVVSKPAGILTQPDGSERDNSSVLEQGRAYIERRYQKPGRAFLGLVHRLDALTSGIVVLARTSKAASRLSEAFRPGGAALKRYACLVHGEVTSGGVLSHDIRYDSEGWVQSVCNVAPSSGMESGSVSAKHAQLSYWPLILFDGPRNHLSSDKAKASSSPAAAAATARASGTSMWTLLDVRLHSGRKHQIRAQMAAAGWPVVGDTLYGGRRMIGINDTSLHSVKNRGGTRSTMSTGDDVPFLGLHNYFLSFPRPVKLPGSANSNNSSRSRSNSDTVSPRGVHDGGDLLMEFTAPLPPLWMDVLNSRRGGSRKAAAPVANLHSIHNYVPALRDATAVIDSTTGGLTETDKILSILGLDRIIPTLNYK